MIKNITLLIFLALFATAAHATPSIELSLGNAPATVIVESSQPRPPFFLNEIWRRGGPSRSWESIGYSYQGDKYTDSVPASGVYEYRARSYNPTGSPSYNRYTSFSGVKSINVSVSSAPSAAPRISSPNSSSTGNFSVTWTTSPGAVSYTLQRKQGSSAWSQAYSGSNTSQNLFNLRSGVYTFRVKSCNSFGCSSWSTPSSTTVTISTTQVPARPEKVFVPTQGIVAWHRSTRATYYELRNSSSQSNLYSGENTHYYFGGQNLSSNFRVRACNLGGCSGWTYTQ